MRYWYWRDLPLYCWYDEYSLQFWMRCISSSFERMNDDDKLLLLIQRLTISIVIVVFQTFLSINRYPLFEQAKREFFWTICMISIERERKEGRERDADGRCFHWRIGYKTIDEFMNFRRFDQYKRFKCGCLSSICESLFLGPLRAHLLAKSKSSTDSELKSPLLNIPISNLLTKTTSLTQSPSSTHNQSSFGLTNKYFRW